MAAKKPAKLSSGKAPTVKVEKKCAIIKDGEVFTAIDRQRNKRVSHGTDPARVRVLAGRKGYEVTA